MSMTMQLSSRTLVLAAVAAVALAAVGSLAANSCTTTSGIAGTCIEEDDCYSPRRTQNRRCMRDGPSVKCCYNPNGGSAQATSNTQSGDQRCTARGGTCMGTQACKNQSGRSSRGLCAGSWDRQCCTGGGSSNSGRGSTQGTSGTSGGFYPCNQDDFWWAVMMAESGGNTRSRYMEPAPLNQVSGGLFQLSVTDGRIYGCNLHRESDLYDAAKNTDCKNRIAARLQQQSGSRGWSKALGRYWSVLRDPNLWGSRYRTRFNRFRNYARQRNCNV